MVDKHELIVQAAAQIAAGLLAAAYGKVKVSEDVLKQIAGLSVSIARKIDEAARSSSDIDAMKVWQALGRGD